MFFCLSRRMAGEAGAHALAWEGEGLSRHSNANTALSPTLSRKGAGEGARANLLHRIFFKSTIGP